MAADQGLLDSVADGNVKTVAEMAAWSTAQVMAAHAQVVQDHAAHRARLNILAETTLSQAIKGIQEVDPIEAISVIKGMTGNDLAQQITQLLAALASNQQGAKVAQSTPPETAKPT